MADTAIIWHWLKNEGLRLNKQEQVGWRREFCAVWRKAIFNAKFAYFARAAASKPRKLPHELLR
jgi:hypothetical protein